MARSIEAAAEADQRMSRISDELAPQRRQGKQNLHTFSGERSAVVCGCFPAVRTNMQIFGRSGGTGRKAAHAYFSAGQHTAHIELKALHSFLKIKRLKQMAGRLLEKFRFAQHGARLPRTRDKNKDNILSLKTTFHPYV